MMRIVFLALVVMSGCSTLDDYVWGKDRRPAPREYSTKEQQKMNSERCDQCFRDCDRMLDRDAMKVCRKACKASYACQNS